jgi:hypothetical protein
MGTGGPFPGLERSRGVTLTTYPDLVPRSSMSRSYSFYPPWLLHESTRTSLVLTLYIVKDRDLQNLKYWIFEQLVRLLWQAINPSQDLWYKKLPFSDKILVWDAELNSTAIDYALYKNFCCGGSFEIITKHEF